MSETTTDTNGKTVGESEAAENDQLLGVPSPQKVLPSGRAKVESQLDILRAFPAASGPTKKPVANQDVANIAGVSPSTVSSCNGFFADIGFIQRSGRGYVPSEAVYEFSRAHEWEPTTAALKLAPILASSWVWHTLGPRLSFGEKTTAEVLAILADAASAGPDYKPQLLLLIDFCQAAGLISRDNDRIKKAAPVSSPPASESEAKPPASSTPLVDPPKNQMTFSINITVDTDLFSKWDKPEQITQFFSEWAKLVAAKLAIEKMIQ